MWRLLRSSQHEAGKAGLLDGESDIYLPIKLNRVYIRLLRALSSNDVADCSYHSCMACVSVSHLLSLPIISQGLWRLYTVSLELSALP